MAEGREESGLGGVGAGGFDRYPVHQAEDREDRNGDGEEGAAHGGRTLVEVGAENLLGGRQELMAGLQNEERAERLRKHTAEPRAGVAPQAIGEKEVGQGGERVAGGHDEAENLRLGELPVEREEDEDEAKEGERSDGQRGLARRGRAAHRKSREKQVGGLEKPCDRGEKPEDSDRAGPHGAVEPSGGAEGGDREESEVGGNGPITQIGLRGDAAVEQVCGERESKPDER